MNKVDKLKIEILRIQEDCKHVKSHRCYSYDSSPEIGYINSICLDCSKDLPRIKISHKEAFYGFWTNEDKPMSDWKTNDMKNINFSLPIKDIKKA